MNPLFSIPTLVNVTSSTPEARPAAEVVEPRLARGSCLSLTVENVVLAAGSIVDGRYQLSECASRGRHAEVWEAIDQDDDRVVIIKVAARRGSHFASADGALLDGRQFVVMEKVEGISLREWLGAYSAMTARGVITVVTQLARALSSAHAAGRVHGAITPEHVVFGGEGPAATITLLGLGTSLGNGSPSYLAPEQLVGSTVDARTDVFALTALAVEMLSGRSPFACNTMSVDTAFARRRAGMVARIELAPEDEHLRAALVKGLADDPADRWESVAALVAALT